MSGSVVRVLIWGVLLASQLCGAETADPTAPVAAAPHVDAWWHPAGTPRWCGPLTAAIGLIPLFYGWRLIRWSMALAVAGVSSGVVIAETLPVWDASLAWTAAVATAIIGGALGFFLYQAVVALQLAALLASALVQLVLWYIPHFTLGALVIGAIGAAIGGIIGWRLAPMLGIIETVVFGVFLVIEGMAILIGVESESEFLLLVGVVTVVTIVPGVIVQLRAHRRGE